MSVFTTTALDLEAFWSPRGRRMSAGVQREDGIEVRRYEPASWPGRRYLLKAVSLVPHRPWQCLAMPCNPIAREMWRDVHRLPSAFDIIHATAFPYAWPIMCGLRLARRLGVPFLVTPFLHLGDPDDRADRTRRRYMSPALMWLLRQADRVFVQTEPERDVLLKRAFPADKVVLLGMGVAPAECTSGDRARAREAWMVSSSEVVIGHLANNSEEKGSVDLLRAAEICWQRGAQFRLVLAGPEMPNFQRFWRRYGPAARVHRLGVLSESQKRDFFAAIDLFALPSRSDSFGLVLLEAWANGVANVGYRAGGIAGVIRHEEDGLLVRCGDVGGLAAALERLGNDAALRRRFGDTGRQRTLLEFRWEDKLRRVREVYEDAIHDHQRTKGRG